MILKHSWAKLKGRQVYNVAVGFIVIAWSFIQVLSQLALLFEVPRSVVRLIVLLVVFMGFPVVVGLAWVFDLRRRGPTRTGDIVVNNSVATEPACPGNSGSAG